MRQPTRTRSAGTIVLSLVVAALVAGPLPVAAHGTPTPAAVPRAQKADLASALGSDGTFHGAPGLAGTVDTSAWTLVSDLASGEPPRFAPAANNDVTPIGPWSALGSNGAGDGALSGQIYAVAVSGSNLYVGGFFANAAGIPAADNIAKWNGIAWSAVGSNGAGDGALNNSVFALAALGTDLYVGGAFTNAAGIATADFIAKWSGGAWSALGSNGAGDGALNFSVFALAVSVGGLYVGGNFSNAAGIAEADNVAKWTGSAWLALGSNGAGNGALNSFVDALAVSGTDVYVGGDFTEASGIATADAVAKWNGSTWSGLGSNGAGNGAINGVVYALAASGSDVYVGGSFLDAAGIPEADNVARWNGSWSVVGSNGAGDGALNGRVLALAVSGAYLYAGGIFTNAAGIATADHVARWNGSEWSSLGSNGAGDGALNLDVEVLAVSGSDLYVGGFFTNAGGIATADFVAKWGLGARTFIAADFNGDFRTDIAVYRPSEGRWYINGQGFFQFGLSTDIPVPADYNGDGTTDIAVYRPSEGRWYINGQGSTQFGLSTDIPVPADYTGDGISDLAVYRPSEGRWYINGQASIQYGTSTDIPVPADYTGDGITDIAVYRPSEGRWYINGLGSTHFGLSTDIPVPSDYTGDGSTDIAVYRPSEGRWYINGQGNTQFGLSTDIPMPAGYFGDGMSDFAVYRRSEGRWYISGQGNTQFGTSTDIPLVIPAAVRLHFFP